MACVAEAGRKLTDKEVLTVTSKKKGPLRLMN